MSSQFFCEQVVAPGVVITLKKSSQPTWGVTVPHSHWQAMSKPDVVNRFDEYSGVYPQIPYLEFTNAEEWRLRFGLFPVELQPLCWLEDFGLKENRAGPTMLWACARRDGSRYYSQLHMWLPMIARAASKDFSDEELRKECVGVQEQIVHGQAIHKWQKSNPDWRRWKTVYPPEHLFHFDLF